MMRMAFLESIALNSVWLLSAGFLLGLMVGGFLNVVIHRLPIMLARGSRYSRSSAVDGKPQTFNLLVPGPHCAYCKQRIRLRHIIPLLGYMLLRGRCAHCRQPISFQYPGVELLTALCSALILSGAGITLVTPALLVLTWCLIVLAVINLKHLLLPDQIILPLLWLGLLTHVAGLSPAVSLEDGVIGATVGYLSLWLISQLFKRPAFRQGLGYGDFILLATLGAWLGWQGLTPILFISCVTTTLAAMIVISIFNRDRGAPTAYGAHLALAGYATMLYSIM